MESILLNGLPIDWTPMRLFDNCQEILLTPTDAEYIRIHDLTSGTFNQQTYNITRVQNPVLYHYFQIRQTELSFDRPIFIKELIHDTDYCNVSNIINFNLDWKLCHRFKYGRGVSFATTAIYANSVSNKLFSPFRAMIIADVIVSNHHEGNYNTVLPNIYFDTTCSPQRNVFVKYHEHEFYPKYVVYYRNKQDDVRS